MKIKYGTTKMVTKIKPLLICTMILFYYGCASNKLDQFKKIDERYRNQIIGTWVVDTDREEAYPYSGYLEYFKDGTSKVHFFEGENCQVEEVVGLDLWKIYNGYLYYKDVNGLDWSEDKIIELSDTHHVLLSEGKKLYRKRGIVCNNLNLSDE
ncbi:MAG: hypothetical protein JKX98_10820 [Alcanivoracaceae bacterium]|nr:hypothetical protein [Alcanivoracaceae bacterium]